MFIETQIQITIQSSMGQTLSRRVAGTELMDSQHNGQIRGAERSLSADRTMDRNEWTGTNLRRPFRRGTLLLENSLKAWVGPKCKARQALGSQRFMVGLQKLERVSTHP
jgi:hypothetical protein